MTQILPISSIILTPDRQRQDFNPDSLTELSNSIASIGLLHAPIIRQSPDGPILVAGERRLRAVSDLHALGVSIVYNRVVLTPDCIPVTDLGELDAIEAEEAELDENLRRANLSWQEEASAVARLHALRLQQSQFCGKNYSIASTVSEVEQLTGKTTSYSATREQILVADHLSNPEIAKAATAKDALKILKRQEETSKNKELAERVGATYSSQVHQLFNEDCLLWLRSAADSSFDCILTDPPYGMGADSFGDGGGKLSNSEHHYEDSYEAWHTLISQLCSELFRTAKPQSHAYIFCDIERFAELKEAMVRAGWYVFRTPLTVYKLGSGRVPLPENGPRRQSEWCLYAIKGWKPVNHIASDVIPCKLEENIGHGANKPIELYTDLLRRSCRPGDSVLDCFCGTGTIFPAAHSLKLRATGIELNPEYYGISVSRLKSLDDEPNLL